MATTPATITVNLEVDTRKFRRSMRTASRSLAWFRFKLWLFGEA
jgi:hypothetical protein